MSKPYTPDSGDEKKEPIQEDSALGTSRRLSHQAINASGHRDQLDRNYGFLSICGMALTVDNAWVAIGTSLNVAISELKQAMEIDRGV
jgi:choline transport protein